MSLDPSARLRHEITERAVPLSSRSDLSPLLERIKDAKVVMLGEASHGTHDYYEWRRIISQELIKHHGFRFIAVEGDWPPCQELHRFVTEGVHESARAALLHFTRWPTWMWANSDVERLAEWMRQHNSTLLSDQRVGFHGLDVYSLFESIREVIAAAGRINPFLARRITANYRCFDRFLGDERSYARSLIEDPHGCERESQKVLHDLMDFRLNGLKDREADLFDARQNARIVCNAENYYRTMVFGQEDSWNVRDRHMMETLELLLQHYGPFARGIVWEHNTHIGDYRATDMLKAGQVNIGGLARERLGENHVALVGFGSYKGTVIASHSWDGPIQTLAVPPARAESYEAIFHDVAQSENLRQHYVIMRDRDRESGSSFSETRGHRAIGVVYDPDRERWGNYVPTSLARRYDAFVYIDETRALEPYDLSFEREEFPETWPRGQ